MTSGSRSIPTLAGDCLPRSKRQQPLYSLELVTEDDKSPMPRRACLGTRARAPARLDQPRWRGRAFPDEALLLEWAALLLDPAHRQHIARESGARHIRKRRRDHVRMDAQFPSFIFGDQSSLDQR